MTEEMRERVWDLFDRAVELPEDQRQELLDLECQSDMDLRHEIDSLLQHVDGADGQPEDFLRSPLIRSCESKESEVDRSLPTRIGRYRIIRFLSAGAMGTVYEAEQEKPQRFVAVKALRRGCLSNDMRRRFLKESHILGQLRHHGIAQIYEAGVDESGIPFFAMELIRGQPIDQYASAHHLSLSERLQLMASVCDAVDHAHKRGVTHRDIKPANILVDETGQCKVLDFGIARTSDSELHSTTHTETGQLLGTLSYMSPEQVSAKASEIDSRTDVYALGLVLYELVSGARAYNIDHLPLPEAARTIRENEPRPLGTIDKRLRGDVETIASKSLEKERLRRYASAGALRDDILRHLAHESIHARPASTLYRLRKFSHRNRMVLSIICLLILGLIGTSGFAGLALHKSAVAEKEKAAALLEAYVARLSVASAALEDYDASTAKSQLNATPLQLRGWEWRYLASRLDTSYHQQELSPGHEAQAVSCSDGLYVQHSTDRSTSIRDIGNHEIIRINFEWPVSYVSSVAKRAAEARVYVVTENRHLIVAQSGRVLAELEPPSPRLGRAIAFSQDLRLFAIAWFDHGCKIELYDLENGQLLQKLEGHSGRIHGLNFTHDGSQLASSGEDGTIRIWETASGRLLNVCHGHTGNVWSVAFSPDSKRLVSASADGTVRQWSSQTGELIGLPFDRHQGDVTSAIYNWDGSRIASSAHDRTIRVWSASDQREHMVLYGEKSFTSLGFSPDGQQIAAGDRTSIVRFWNVAGDVASPMLLPGHSKSVYPVTFSPDGSWIASGGWDNKVNVWNARTGQLIATKETQTPVKSVCFTPDSSGLILIDKEVPYFRRWSFQTDQTVAEKVVDALREVPATLAVSPDGKHLAAAGLAGAHVWNLETGKLIKTLSVWDCYAHKLAYSPDGKWLIGPGPGVSATSLWSTDSYQLHVELMAGERSDSELNFAVAFSPDSTLAATGSRETQLRLWDVKSGKLMKVLRGHTDEIFAIAFHPTERRLASSGRDRLIRIWDLDCGKVMTSLKGHKSYVWSLAYSPDGETLVSGGGDTSVRLWSTRSSISRKAPARLSPVFDQ